MDGDLERFAAGDVDAFEALFRRHQGEVYGWIVRIVRHPAAAEDLTIETFWRIYLRRKRFDPQRPFGPWARRIATRIAIDYLRSESHSLAPPPPPPSAAPDPLVRGELHARIREVFLTLPARLRVAATLALIEGTPFVSLVEIDCRDRS